MINTEEYDYNQILDSLYKYLCEIIKVYEDMLPVMKEELEAIINEDISLLNENLKKQQALLLKTKDFDRVIEEYALKLNIRAKNLSSLTSLIQELPQEPQLRFFELINRFDEAIKSVSFYKEKCRALLQTQLHSINKIIAESGEATTQNKTYQQNASVGIAHSNFFETTI